MALLVAILLSELYANADDEQWESGLELAMPDYYLPLV